MRSLIRVIVAAAASSRVPLSTRVNIIPILTFLMRTTPPPSFANILPPCVNTIEA